MQTLKVLLASFVILLALGVKTNAQINRVEYFIDNDPGFGKATAIPVTAANIIADKSASINLSSVATGIHNLFIRSRHANGTWSISNQVPFFKTSLAAIPNISRVEYFFDTDPGFGKATAINTAAQSDVSNQSAAIDLTTTGNGFHNLFIRSRDNGGKWSMSNQVAFFKTGALDSAKILQAEYYLDTDPGFGLATAVPVTAASDISNKSTIINLTGVSLGRHNFFFRTKDANGKWSITNQKSFLICNTAPAVSRFDFQVEGNQVFFTNLSDSSNSRLWDFGDGTSSSVLNPIKTYNQAGNFTVNLYNTNTCNTDTLTTMFSVAGLQRINATKGGNNGVATVILDGVGFAASTVIKLQNANSILFPADKLFISSNRVIAYFNLVGTNTGKYNVVADITGSSLDTLRDGFTIEPGKPIIVQVEDRGGRNPARFGNMSRQIVLQNTSNEDAIMLPFITGVAYNPLLNNFGIVSNQVLVEPTIFQNTLQYLADKGISSNVMSAFDVDTSRKKQIMAVYKLKVAAESNATINYNITNGSQISAYSNGYMIQPPLYKSGLVVNDIASQNSRDCINSFLKKAVRKNLSVTLSDAGWTNCFNVAFDTLSRSLRDLLRDISQQSSSISMKAVFSTLLVQMSQCGSSGMPAKLTSNQFEKIIKDVTYNWVFLESLDSIGRPCIDTTETIVFGNKAIFKSTAQNDVKRFLNADGCDVNNSQSPEMQTICGDFKRPCEKISEIFFASNSVGQAIFTKLSSALLGGGGCGGGSTASKFCKTLCESGSVDPNVKYGPGFNGNNNYISDVLNTGYSIFFENLASATAPAAYVEITDTIDKTKFDISTFQTGNFGWGDSVVMVDANRTDYALLKNLQPSRPNQLRIGVTLDTVTGIVKWKFSTLDLVTLQLTTNPVEGFLPPNTDGKKGQAFVNFSVKPKAGVTSGTIISNKASIIFDKNSSITTGAWQHIIDTTMPKSKVAALAQNVPAKDFSVTWAGSDAHSGIGSYTIYVSVNDSLYTPWLTSTTAVSALYNGEFGNSYKFISVVVDKAGNYEDARAKQSPDAVTIPLATGQVVSIKNGLWSQPSTWSSNKVPELVNDVLVKHNVTVDINGICKSLKAVVPGMLHINAGIRLDLIGH